MGRYLLIGMVVFFVIFYWSTEALRKRDGKMTLRKNRSDSRNLPEELREGSSSITGKITQIR